MEVTPAPIAPCRSDCTELPQDRRPTRASPGALLTLSYQMMISDHALADQLNELLEFTHVPGTVRVNTAVKDSRHSNTGCLKANEWAAGKVVVRF